MFLNCTSKFSFRYFTIFVYIIHCFILDLKNDATKKFRKKTQAKIKLGLRNSQTEFIIRIICLIDLRSLKQNLIIKRVQYIYGHELKFLICGPSIQQTL